MQDERPRLLSPNASRGHAIGVRAVLGATAAIVLGAILAFVLAAGGDDAAMHAGSATAPTERGVSSGFAHSEPGAVNALYSSVERYSLKVLVDREAAKATFQAIGTPVFVRSELAKWDRVSETEGGRVLAAANRSGKALAQTVPLRYAVDAYDRKRAVIRLWATTFLAGPGLSPSAQFSLDRATLLWDGQRWRLDALEQLREGPTPGALRSELTRSSRSLIEALSGLRELGDAP